MSSFHFLLFFFSFSQLSKMTWKKKSLSFSFPLRRFIILYLVSPWSRCGQTPCCLTNKLSWTCAENNTTKRFTSHIFQFIELGQPLRSLRLTTTIGQSVVFMQSIGAISHKVYRYHRYLIYLGGFIPAKFKVESMKTLNFTKSANVNNS